MDDQKKEIKNSEQPPSGEAQAEKHARAQSSLNDLMRVLDQAEGKQQSKISKVEVTHKRQRAPQPEPAKTPEPVKTPEPADEPPRQKSAPAGGRQQPRSARREKPPAARASSGSAARRREREARRRRRRAARITLLIIAAILVLIAAIAAIRAVSGLASRGDTQDAAAGSAGAAGVSTAAAETDADTDLPASMQESEQYLAIKDDEDLPDYAKEYPGMYADAVAEENTESDEKVCYLTFDDGPSSSVTPDILDTLKEAGVQATFFLVTSSIDEDTESLIQRMVDEGHTICIHANVHEYSDLYSSVEDYLADFAEAYDKIYELTGFRVQGFRFPGGSNNNVMQRYGTYDAIVTEMTRRGFEYYDWNAYDHDAEGGDYSANQLVDFAVDEVTESSRTDVILLMHDTYGKELTAEALPDIIDGLKAAGIEMKPLTSSSRPVHFEVDSVTPSEFPEAETEESGETEDSSGEDSGDGSEDSSEDSSGEDSEA